MNKSITLRKYARILMLFTFTLVICLELLYMIWLKAYSFPGLAIPLLLMWLTTLAGHIALRRTLAKNPGNFTRTFMVSTTVKLFLYLAYMVGYLWFYREYAVPFLLTFVSAYFLFGIFDVVSTLIFLKNEKPNSNQ
jgi:F0F1-type ATP synthase assembly protein I